jgi:hypothetical protein
MQDAGGGRMTRKEALSKAIMTLMYFQAHFCKSKEAVENTQAVIDALEQIEKEPKWIPVSEGVPDDRKKCLVTFKGGYVGIMCYASDLYRVDEYDFCDEKGKAGWFDYDRELGHYSRDDVIAWMLLPTPYKAESEVES